VAHRIPRLAAAAVATLAVLAAGCSSETSPPPESPSATESKPATSGHGSFAHCLGEHGVPAAPGPAAGPPPGVDAGTWQQAMQACASLAPGPGPG
jgi:hypothetical protein